MKNAIAPTHASKTFLIKMFLVFLDLTEPAHNIANPACIKNTREKENDDGEEKSDDIDDFEIAHLASWYHRP
ncbi:unnamed protein product [Bathycoccus prasinos]